MLNIFASAESTMNINSAMIEVKTMTTAVEPINSSRVDQDTFPSSAFTSLKKLIDLETMYIFFYRGGGT